MGLDFTSDFFGENVSLITEWTPYFDNTTRQRGRDYYKRGRVHQVPPEEGEVARAIVHGRALYDTVLRSPEDETPLSCTCPHFERGSYCKHLWALMIAVDTDGVIEPDEEPIEIPVGKAMKRGGTATARKRDRKTAAPRREPEWVGRMSLLSPFRYTQTAAPPILSGSRQFAYVLDIDLSHMHGGVALEVHQVQPSTSAGARLRPVKLNRDTLEDITDPIDRELCGLLLGSTWAEKWETGDWATDHRKHTAFMLPNGTWRALLQRIVQFGRAYVRGPHTAPQLLKWDGAQGAWALWMIGEHTDEGLSVTVELRRQGYTELEYIAIDEPDLIIGGKDGIVLVGNKAAPFDDCGAFRWVNHFREDERRGRLASPLVVPPADVERFLERLYMMADLPHVDLPSDVAPPYRVIKPRPTVELFSPDGPIKKGSGVKHVTGRVWFNYGDIRIDPRQPGRFIVPKQDEDDFDNVDGMSGADGDFDSDSDRESGGASDNGTDASHDARIDDDVVHDATDRSDSPAELDDSSAGADAGDDGDATSAETTSTADADPTQTEVATTDELGDVGETDDSSLIERDLPYEQSAIGSLSTLGFRGDSSDADVLQLPASRMPQAVSTLIRNGWTVQADQHVVRGATMPRLTIRSGVDWFEVHGGVKFQTDQGEQVVPLPDILKAAREGKAMITLDDGSQGMLPEEWLEQHGLLAAIGEVDGDHLKFKNSQAILLDMLLDEKSLVDVDAQFAEAREKLQQFERIEPVQAPESFLGELRPYQADGLGWLHFLRWFGMGGILADDMGLGKTIQVLAMLEEKYNVDGSLSSSKKSGNGKARSSRDDRGVKATKPSIVVVPRSVVFNWLDEASRFTPNLKVLSYAGPDRKDMVKDFGDAHLIVTSYGLLRRDIVALQEVEFEYVILDEAQAIKNPGAQVAKAARVLNANHRLALTGTPVENHLGDLWSIFEFLNPGMLGSATRFAEVVKGRPSDGKAGKDDEHGEMIAVPPGSPQAQQAADAAAAAAAAAEAEKEKEGEDTKAHGGEMVALGSPGLTRDLQVAQSTAKALRPFILRRTKQEVLTDLPDKTEQTIVCEMEPAQRKVYDDLLKYYRGNLLKKIDTGGNAPALRGGGGMSMMVLEALLRLRQASCHPGLIDEKRSGEPSAKLEALLEHLAELIDEGSKALVFSQFTSMLAIVRKRLDETGVNYEYLDGKTRKRRKHVERFQKDPDCSVFLISLKAGGLGLNLTAADYVFILDPWWNPAVEQQAIDRAHRIGQKKHVFAYRLICKDTVEQRIAELQAKKKQLADAIVGGQQNVLKSLTKDDLELLLS